MRHLTITCFWCNHVGTSDDFHLSCADECFCPKCGERFELGDDDDEDDEDDEEDAGKDGGGA